MTSLSSATNPANIRLAVAAETLIACEQTDRSCCTIELDEKFCDVIVKRYIEQVGSADGVSVQRDGLTYRYDELVGKED